MKSYEIEYKGYVYSYEDDYEEDNIKRFHSCKTPDGANISVPFSPYHHISDEEFHDWIDLGMPTYNELGGNILSREHLERIKADKKKS